MEAGVRNETVRQFYHSEGVTDLARMRDSAIKESKYGKAILHLHKQSAGCPGWFGPCEFYSGGEKVQH